MAPMGRQQAKMPCNTAFASTVVVGKEGAQRGVPARLVTPIAVRGDCDPGGRHRAAASVRDADRCQPRQHPRRARHHDRCQADCQEVVHSDDLALIRLDTELRSGTVEFASLGTPTRR